MGAVNTLKVTLYIYIIYDSQVMDAVVVSGGTQVNMAMKMTIATFIVMLPAIISDAGKTWVMCEGLGW